MISMQAAWPYRILRASCYQRFFICSEILVIREQERIRQLIGRPDIGTFLIQHCNFKFPGKSFKTALADEDPRCSFPELAPARDRERFLDQGSCTPLIGRKVLDRFTGEPDGLLSIRSPTKNKIAFRIPAEIVREEK